MAAFLFEQIDYIFFLTGMIFALISVMCYFSSGAKSSQIDWKNFIWFCAFVCIGYWARLVDISVNGYYSHSKVGFVIASFAFVFLFEFARQNYNRLYNKSTGIWMLIVLLPVCSIIVAFDRNLFILSSILFLLLPSGLWATFVIYKYSKNNTQNRLTSAYLRMSALFLFIALISSLLKIPIVLDIFINSSNGNSNSAYLFFVPELFLAPFMFMFLVTLWLYFRSINELKIITKQYIALAACFITILVVSFFGVNHIEKYAEKVRLVNDSFHIEKAVVNVSEEIQRIMNASESIASAPVTAKCLSENKNYNSLNKLLDLYSKAYKGTICYVLDKNGVCIASSNRNTPDNLIGNSYAFRSYFKDALATDKGFEFCLGITTNQKGAYASTAVYSDDGSIVGVVAVKSNFENLQNQLNNFWDIFIIDPNGKIFYSSNKDLEDLSFWDLDKAKDNILFVSLSENFIESIKNQKNTGNINLINRDGVLGLRKFISNDGWSMIIIHPASQIEIFRLVLLAIVALIFAVIIISFAIIRNKEKQNILLDWSAIFWENTFNSMDGGLCIIDKDFNIIKANKNCKSLFGLESFCFIEGKKCYEVFQKTDTICNECPHIKTITKGITANKVMYEFLLDKYIEVTTSPMYDENRNIIGSVHISKDVTERTITEEKLNLQISAMQAAEDQIVITDIEGIPLFINSSFEKQTGFEINNIEGDTPAFIGFGLYPKEFYHMIWQTIQSGNIWKGEILNRRKNGELYSEEITITPIKNADNKIEHFITIKRDVTEKKRFQEKIDKLAYQDSLTGLPNKLLFAEKLNNKLNWAKENNKSFAVLFFDIDEFVLINEIYGHNFGDNLLICVAERLKQLIKSTDTIARMGGDEFTIILEDIESKEDVYSISEKLIDEFNKPFKLENKEVYISASLGVSICPFDGEDVETLLKNADSALYKAKELGRGKYQIYNEAFIDESSKKIYIEASLRKAIENNENEFVLYYQPRVDIRTCRIVGAEALIRWNHSEMGFVSPDKFINIAEETGLILPITNWVIKEACTQTKNWHDMGLPMLTIAINISPKHFSSNNLTETLANILNETGLNPSKLDIEITENVLLNNSEEAIETLNKIKELGVSVHIDDFGTGYSSLSYLKKFPIDAVKIDRSFISEIQQLEGQAAIPQAIIAMSHSLKLKVIAEGVETPTQMQILRELECDEMQGYFISKPLPADEFTQLLFTDHNNCISTDFLGAA
ncbi:MAG: EAL domain-containing protein [Armatimonadota bacterium]